MPVTGLPAAAEAALSSLVQTQGLKSWKVVGEGRSTVMVLRFQPEDGQPCTETSSQYFRLKPPSQRRRDLQRRISFQQRFGHSFNRPQSHAYDDVGYQPNCDAVDKRVMTRQEDENKPTEPEETLHETRTVHASVGARSSRSPSGSSACVTAVSGVGSCADPVAACTEKATAEIELGSENDESQKVTPEIVRELIEKLDKSMDKSHQRSLDSLLSALRSPVDALPTAVPSPAPSTSEEVGLGASKSVYVANASSAAPDQVAFQTEVRRVGKEKRTTSSRQREDSSPIRRSLRSYRR